jgi:predicted amidohydrolase
MSDLVKIAAVQTEPGLMKNRENLAGILEWVAKAAAGRANLVVFPECSLTGYIFRSREEVLPFAETVPGPSTEEIASRCRELGVYVVFGLLEREGDRLFNAAVLVGPQGFIAGYRKNHLPFLGVDRFCDRGDRPFAVHRTPIGNIGLYICYDIVFPESSRVMTLMGADILALPTNFPQVRRETLSTYIVNARAIENRVHVVAADRVGGERGYGFAGLSKIVSASGKTLGQASPDEEEIIYAEVSLASAREKRQVIVPGAYEIDYLKDRRPELYGLITEPGSGGA